VPIETIQIQPGVNLQATPTLNRTQWAQSQLIRFYEGLCQKLGGWSHFSSTAVIGTCRAMLGWADLLQNTYLATGTEQRLQVLIGGSPSDITPIVQVSNIAVHFSTTSGSSAVTIADSFAPNAGDWMNLITQVSVGGLVLSGYYQVQTTGSGNYTITAASKATATVTNGGAVPSFTTTNSSSTVTVLLANHGFTAGVSSFNVPISTGVGGVTLNGPYAVATVVDSSHFTIIAATSATSGATVSLNGGQAQIDYLLPTGQAVNVAESGYGIGDYGSGDYGLANGSSGTLYMRVWALDHWGQDLVACPLDGMIYYWQPGTTVAAQVVSGTAPLYNKWIFVAPEVQILVALGAESGGTQYPLLVRWCDAADFTDWTPTVSNQAGSFQLNSGSKLVFGCANGLTLYLWTDLGLWTVAYQGLPYVFSFTEVARNCGAISSRAVALGAVGATWLSTQGFFQLSGSGVVPLECPVWDFYNNNVDLTQKEGITAAINSTYHEVTWYFPMIGGGTMGYVKWNWLESQGGPAVWDYGTLTRTAWIDASPVAGPLGVDGNGLIQQHEVSPDADGQPMLPSAQTHYFFGDGEQYVFADMLQPDYVASVGATIQHTVLTQDYASGTVTSDGPYAMQPNPSSGNTLPVAWVDINSRGRQLALLINSTDAGSSWRLGAMRYRYEPDGSI
jgi:hypothetical protein